MHPDAARWAGPDALGRSLLLAPGDIDRRGVWEHAAEFLIDAAALEAPGPLLEAVRTRWHRRERCVFFIAPGTTAPLEVVDNPAWAVDARFTFAGEELWHLAHANSVDGRHGTWHWSEMAVNQGATAGGPRDVVLRDGTAVWCDGGPLRATVDEPVVHRLAIETGSMSTLGPNATAAELAADQLAAVTHPGGGARIIAPAGSGKTRVLTERARLLLDGWRLPTSALTLVAFNKRAATEMAERTADLPRLHIRTLNALAYAIVNGAAPFARQSVRRSVIDEREVRRILDTLVTFPRRANTDPAAAWIEALASVRLGLRRPSDVEAEFDGDVEGLVEVVGRYRALLAERNVVDFDEQIVAAIELLLRSPEARAAAQRACRVLLIDEFQDLAPAHLLLVRLLASPDLAIFAVGDDDQTIYGYAGATPRWLVGFSDLVAGAGDHPLTVNYRCPPAVVNAASTLLSHNITRVAKTISPAPGRAPEPRDLEIVQGDPVALTVEAVQEALRTGAPASSIAVLARVTASLAPVQIALSHHGVPVRAAVDEQWLERGGMASALAWLRLANDPEQLRSVDVVAAARRPPRSIAPKVLQWMGEQTSVTGLRRLGSRLNGRDSERVIGFADDLDRVVSTGRSGDTLAMLRVVRDSIGLDGAIATLDGARRRLDRSAQIDDLDALVALASLHPDPSTFERWLRTSLRRPGDPDGVALNTIHAVKGREWPTVIVHDVTAGLLPHRLADDLEEERRVFHVAITRARQRTVVVASATAPSRFIHELSVARDPNAAVPTEEPRRRLPAPPPRIAEVVLNESGQQRAEALRTWRSSRARQDKVPAYVVFSNLTLDAIAAAAPATLAELARISGVGPTKLERYGDEVLAALAETA